MANSRSSPRRSPWNTRARPSEPGSGLPNASRTRRRVSRVIGASPSSVKPTRPMRNQKYVKIVIWVVVIGMVLSLAVAAISLFA